MSHHQNSTTANTAMAIHNLTNTTNTPMQSASNLRLLNGNLPMTPANQTPASTASPPTSMRDDSTIVGLHYKIGKKIGEGSFGVLFEGTNMINGLPVAIKFEPRKTEAPQLKDEYRTYKILTGTPGVPQASLLFWSRRVA